MPVLNVTAIAGRPLAAFGGPLEPELDAALARKAPGAPVIVMIHGYKYDPARRERSPHRRLFALHAGPPVRRVISWPRRLGVAPSGPGTLAIGFGWSAGGSIWRAGRAARRAGRALAELVAAVHARGGRPVSLIAHSLGARVALAALPRLPALAVDRAVLLSAAALRSEAVAARATPAGRTAEIFNVTTRENDLYDFLFERLDAPLALRDAALGAGLGHAATTWLDIQIDGEETRAALDRLGFRIPAPRRRVCHWSSYLRPGLFPFYRALLERDPPLPLPVLAAALPAERAPRWSRLLSVPAAFPGLPRRT